MKNIAFIFLFLLGTSVIAQENLQRSLVTVSGEGVVKVQPDEVLIKSRIEHEGSSAASVKSQNDKVVNDVIKYLRSQGIKKEDIQTDYVNLNKRYDYNEKTYSYVANQAISITLHELNEYEKIMRGLLENGLNRIDGIEFRSSEMEKYEKLAREKAVLDAQETAKQLTQPLGQEIGKAVSISEMEYNSVQPVYRMSEAMDIGASKEQQHNIAPGELEIKIKVNVAFELK